MRVPVFLAGLLAGVILATAAVGGAQTRLAELVYRGISIQVNGQTVAIPGGREPFILNGSTYVPLRLVAEALGAVVRWDGENSRVLITANPTPDQKVFVQGAAGTIQDWINQRWMVHFTGVVINATSSSLENPSVICTATTKSGQIIANAARTFEAVIKPNSSIAFDFDSQAYKEPAPTEIIVTCEAAS